MRVCQPLPIALNASRTSTSNRMVVDVLRGFFCGPRIPGLRSSAAKSGPRISGSASEAGRARANSSFVSSRTSPSSSINGNRFSICTGLPGVGFSETDNPNPPLDGREAQDVQPFIQISNGYKTKLRIVVPVSEMIAASDQSKPAARSKRNCLSASFLALFLGSNSILMELIVVTKY